ncbi:stage 0 sporulation regulatory protein [Cytobacillus eiseniae]|uniref:Stage 0 sporulation regulatory protein n=1 Tax=Cytobacillus eiseniae TaxID=762947 RepID=A0ABS4RH17_9BACI|nr:aspartyl-phosphate phosphatase Spo0E family protein [Cytobacillus eiseniae]MBP2241619.1 stage 0 sporulation regulatory protein [Cytobacillus eiseniae]
MNASNLLKEIEECRKEMIELASIFPLSNKEVVAASKRLDQLLNLYEKQGNKPIKQKNGAVI